MGKFIAIEGGDGSGKSTQSDLLASYLESAGVNVHRMKFPRYGNDSAYYVEKYLNGAYGQANEVPADLGVLPYAIDRYAASDEIRTHLANGSTVICDRYMGSNLAHQGTKIQDAEERKKFYERTQTTEYDVLGIPKADLNIVLLMPTDAAQKSMLSRADRAYTSNKLDIHEASSNHLELAKRNYEELCELYSSEFIAIDCTNRGIMRSIDDIHQSILKLV